MLSLIAEDLARYVEAHTSRESPLLSELREVTYRDLASPQMQVGSVEGVLLKMLVQLTRTREALEVGTFSGYSSLSIAAGLPAAGRLITCDVDPIATRIAQQFFDRSPHGHKIELRLGWATTTLATLAEQGRTFDFAFIDADKENYVRYWDLILPMLRPGGLVVADNTLWSGRVLNPTSEADHGVVAFNEHVARDARVEHVLLSVRDGIMLARKHEAE